LVYGLFEGTRAGGARQPVVVEGPLDVLAIAARQSAGNSFGLLPVAPSGTAVTVVQARRVAEVALDNRLPVVVAMDGDAPGRAGALTAGEHLRNAGVDVRIATLPNGTDPAEHIARPDGSVDVFHADHGLPLVTARIVEAVARQGDSIQWAEGRLRAVRDITRYLATYSPDYAARQVAGVATRLGFDAHTVTTELADAFHARHVEVGRGKRAGVHVDL
jgi:DNA primase